MVVLESKLNKLVVYTAVGIGQVKPTYSKGPVPLVGFKYNCRQFSYCSKQPGVPGRNAICTVMPATVEEV